AGKSEDPYTEAPDPVGLPGTAEPETTEKEEKNGSRIPPVLAAALILTGALLLSGNIPGWYADSAGKLVAGVIMAAGAGVLILHLRKRQGSRQTNAVAGNLTPGGIEDIFADMDMGETFRKEPDRLAKSMEAPGTLWEDRDEICEPDPEENYGKTVFVGAVDQPVENILVEKGKKKEYRIDHFPFTIGKRKDCVDLALTDRSVSRIHARIVQKNGKTYLQDCRSTNGTYLNGVQLEAEETVMLEREDEIEIGNVKFSYL
ncbi:MAG: FHA domain-containing protein, partial [Lachnospiraceae bacterium]|nr:FHA domain-containing protein [Lachnospiraceae bacterium]